MKHEVEYERYKRYLKSQALSPEEYERKIKEYCNSEKVSDIVILEIAYQTLVDYGELKVYYFMQWLENLKKNLEEK